MERTPIPGLYAHSTERADEAGWEPLEEHLRDVAQLAAQFAAPPKAHNAAYLAGFLHDFGKSSAAFQAYIRNQGSKAGGVDHSTAGAQVMMDIASTMTAADKIVAELVAYAVAGHHAGLPDRRGGGSGTLDSRLDPTANPIPAFQHLWRDQIEPRARDLLPADFKLDAKNKPALAFSLATLGRMLYSSLVDADFIATERFYQKTTGLEVDREWPSLGARLPDLITRFDAHMDALRAALPAETRTNPLNLLRQEVLTHVRARAALPRGVFTLNVPTGGGKTLASLAFALEHAKRWGMERVVFAIPFTAIIEQTADVFRRVLGDELILEHHSAIERQEKTEEQKALPGDQQVRSRARLAMENWAAPLVVTTNVQLFESLFAHRSSRCRKLHNLANSIIILDEAQVLPLNLLRPCVAMLKELARNYGCTIVLCTATQPALLAPRFEGGFEPETTHELAPDPDRLDAAFRRVSLHIRPSSLDDTDVVEEMKDHPQGLVIVNSRRHALDLYRTAKAADLSGLVHLSTRQTAADRRTILAEVRRRLVNGEPCRLIATSLIEAGVDVSFPRAWRAMAGLDAIIQAGGRVNREWRWSKEESHVIVFTPSVAKPPHEIARFAQAMGRVASGHEDLFCQAAIEDYFTEVYWQTGAGLDQIRVPDADGRKQPRSVLSLFGISGGRTDFAYRTVGENFRLIEEGMAPVIIANKPEVRSVLDALKNRLPASVAARRLQSHVVSIPPKARSALLQNGHVAFVENFADQFAVLKTEDFYNPEIGLLWERADELGEDYIL